MDFIFDFEIRIKIMKWGVINTNIAKPKRSIAQRRRGESLQWLCRHFIHSFRRIAMSLTIFDCGISPSSSSTSNWPAQRKYLSFCLVLSCTFSLVRQVSAPVFTRLFSAHSLITGEYPADRHTQTSLAWPRAATATDIQPNCRWRNDNTIECDKLGNPSAAAAAAAD